ncbi:hypothetical protein CDAR_230631 [Caerostris darwini]|uniref:Uncharacterized protein n=1 Tax=Caerostris darwini TaxID=1538125 RepID=A0AAV4S5G2_9ARAC|nr:hypothetical protein CDAR_230631 [Caerostris darwini]
MLPDSLKLPSPKAKALPITSLNAQRQKQSLAVVQLLLSKRLTWIEPIKIEGVRAARRDFSANGSSQFSALSLNELASLGCDDCSRLECAPLAGISNYWSMPPSPIKALRNYLKGLDVKRSL